MTATVGAEPRGATMAKQSSRSTKRFTMPEVRAGSYLSSTMLKLIFRPLMPPLSFTYLIQASAPLPMRK